jgi:hypothetical protein
VVPSHYRTWTEEVRRPKGAVSEPSGQRAVSRGANDAIANDWSRTDGAEHGAASDKKRTQIRGGRARVNAGKGDDVGFARAAVSDMMIGWEKDVVKDLDLSSRRLPPGGRFTSNAGTRIHTNP